MTSPITLAVDVPADAARVFQVLTTTEGRRLVEHLESGGARPFFPAASA